ncbi:glycolate oxidase subunit GlcF [Lentisalinibacter sediminis]|uniref:glycolate oxidase subunit GlcF n=1 Tax=Lentisalinibacter sediminis TaxID=2992237 RepID=UPI00386BE8CC
METHLTADLKDRPEGRRAAEVIRTCVHCGFCNATCPTFQVLGNELDGPRGRIYLIKRALEGGEVTRETQIHLDRCLTCQACETTCPSGVRYHELLDIGRARVDARVPRPLAERLQRRALRFLFGSRRLLRAMLQLGNAFRFLLPPGLKGRLLQPGRAEAWPAPRHPRRMIALNGCVQPVVSPGIDRAAARLLDAAGVSLTPAPPGCCGAMDYHLGDQAGGLALARQRIREWTHALDEGAEAVVITATGCGAFVQDYGRLFADDPELAEPAGRVATAAKDIGRVLAAEELPPLQAPQSPASQEPQQSEPSPAGGGKVALHCPCTLKNALGEADTVRALLADQGVDLAPVRESIACCGSAGAYSLLQPALSERILERKLADLEAGEPAEIVTGNIGCLHHLAAGTDRPVRHWVELLAERLPATR